MALIIAACPFTTLVVPQMWYSMKGRAMNGTAAIVGAGIGGLATAIGLRRIGWEVTVLERWPEINPEGTALGIRPDAQAALAQLGLREELLRRTVPYRQAVIRTPQGERIADLPLERIERKGGAPVLMLSRTSLMNMLVDALGGHGDQDRCEDHRSGSSAWAA
ncbi:FAD-dependent oxidoreductase [Nonomuraea salmonea]|uniref:FAD-dependent oxidoreductase n=1 Tax=Nonomuraea salmonea TaxID=46181 RepID=UPI0031F09CDD